jgi:hypothetical protein
MNTVVVWCGVVWCGVVWFGGESSHAVCSDGPSPTQQQIQLSTCLQLALSRCHAVSHSQVWTVDKELKGWVAAQQKFFDAGQVCGAVPTAAMPCVEPPAVERCGVTVFSSQAWLLRSHSTSPHLTQPPTGPGPDSGRRGRAQDGGAQGGQEVTLFQ